MSSRDTRGGDLYNLLREHLPEFVAEQGHLHVTSLAKAMEVSHETTYKALRGDKKKGFPEGRVTPQMAVRLLELSREQNPGNRLYAQDLLPFMIPHFEDYSDPASLLE